MTRVERRGIGKNGTKTALKKNFHHTRRFASLARQKNVRAKGRERGNRRDSRRDSSKILISQVNTTGVGEMESISRKKTKTQSEITLAQIAYDVARAAQRQVQSGERG